MEIIKQIKPKKEGKNQHLSRKERKGERNLKC
jgi:hypothetical protein